MQCERCGREGISSNLCSACENYLYSEDDQTDNYQPSYDDSGDE